MRHILQSMSESVDEEILKALHKEQAQIVAAQLTAPTASVEEIVADIHHQANVGRGQQKIGGNSKMGTAPPPGLELTEEDVKDFFNVPGLKKMLKTEQKR